MNSQGIHSLVYSWEQQDVAVSQRQQRINESLKETISEVIRLIKDPRLGFVTLTDVEVSPDLGYARVFFSAYGTDEEKEESTAALKHAAGFVRREVARRMQLRHTPQMDFRLDTTADRAEHVMKLLHEIEIEDAQKAQAAGNEPGELLTEGHEESPAKSPPIPAVAPSN